MSRTTQYIGLSPEAWNFLRSHKYRELCIYHMTEGMFDEPVMGAIYECTLEREGMYSCPGNEYTEEYKETYVEVVQAEHWSSGPCIFTCLKRINKDEFVGKWSDEDINKCLVNGKGMLEVCDGAEEGCNYNCRDSK